MSEFNHAPLTLLSEEEQAFADEIYKFAQKEIAPYVSQMDEESQLQPHVVPKLFEMGLMGVEIPEIYDGVEGSFMLATLAVESLARVDPSVAVVVDVQNTLVNNALVRWCNEEHIRAFHNPDICIQQK